MPKPVIVITPPGRGNSWRATLPTAYGLDHASVESTSRDTVLAVVGILASHHDYEILEGGHRRDAIPAVRDTELEAARAALARARILAGAMLHEAYCAGHPDAERWRVEYAAIDSPEPR